MTFFDELKNFSERITAMDTSNFSEEATKMSMIMPFFQMMGYDVFNPHEFCPEYTADVGIKKGEKVDYAIIIEGSPAILIECKSCNESLSKHSSQLFRYFGTSTAKFGVLTNGLVYKFYTDLEESNKMDLTPFLEIDLTDLKENLVNELKKFSKEIYDQDNIFSTASELKYSNLIKDFLKKEFDDPSEAFLRFILNEIYDGMKSQKVLDKFKPIIKRACTSFINDTVNKKITSALASDPVAAPEIFEEVLENKIITTEEETEAFYIIRGLLVGIVDINDIIKRDTESYFGILYTDNNRKTICRLALDRKKRYMLIPDVNKNFERYDLDSLNDIYKYKSQLIDAIKLYID